MLSKHLRRCPERGLKRTQSGLSIVELLVGITIGLIVVAAAGLMVSSQLSENRRLLLETQLVQDLRASADIITRELRRASYFSGTAGEVWYEGKPAAVAENTYGALLTASGADLTEVQFKYRRRSGDEGPFGFKRDGNVIKSLIGGQWQVLTDARVMDITNVDIDLPAPVVYQLPCPRACDALGSTACWPELQVRTVSVSITGRSALDPNIIRTFATQVRMRNDFTKFNGASICPA